MNGYRDDLEAARLRIAQLEEDLARKHDSPAVTERTRGRASHGGAAFFDAVGAQGVVGLAATMLALTLWCSTLWHGKRSAEERLAALEREVAEAQGDAMEAREEARVLFELFRVRSTQRDDDVRGPLAEGDERAPDRTSPSDELWRYWMDGPLVPRFVRIEDQTTQRAESIASQPTGISMASLKPGHRDSRRFDGLAALGHVGRVARSRDAAPSSVGLGRGASGETIRSDVVFAPR